MLFRNVTSHPVISADCRWVFTGVFNGVFAPSAGDMYTPEDGEEDPEWVESERQQFNEFRDKNHDGKMDKEETLDWILPSDYDHAEAEAKHLLHESDANQVRLTPAACLPV